MSTIALLLLVALCCVKFTSGQYVEIAQAIAEDEKNILQTEKAIMAELIKLEGAQADQQQQINQLKNQVVAASGGSGGLGGGSGGTPNSATVYLTESGTNWYTAAIGCQETKSQALGKTCRLAEIVTQNQLNEISAAVVAYGNGGCWWIGGINSALQSSGNFTNPMQWSWYDLGTPISIGPWGKGYPQANGGNCAAITNDNGVAVYRNAPCGNGWWYFCKCY